MIDSHNTIVALSTATGGALAVIRLSGAKALEILALCFRSKLEDRVATFGNFYDQDGEKVDEVICIYFKAPRSYTGENMVEISCHGSQWIASEIVRVLIRCGAEMAMPGEFTKRAFMNGKMDLSQSEAVADLIASHSKASARVALQQIRGGYSLELSELRGKLLHIKSMLELELDFGEEDVEFASREDLMSLLVELKERCSKLAESFSLGNVLRRGVSVAIVGNPNVGKSTLLNQLVGEERAIVSNIAGTTRDYIEEVVVIDGVEFRFVDTAGIRHTDDEIEAMGIERSLESMRRAEIVVQLVDSDDFEHIEVGESQKLLVVRNKSDKENVGDVNVAGSVGDSIMANFGSELLDCTLFSEVVDVQISGNVGGENLDDSPMNQCESSQDDSTLLSDGVGRQNSANVVGGNIDDSAMKKRESLLDDTLLLSVGVNMRISAKLGLGVDDLRSELVRLSGISGVSVSEILVVSNERHYELLSRVVESCDESLGLVGDGMSGDLVSFSLSRALEYLGEITGEFTSDEVLATIFSSFCIGK